MKYLDLVVTFLDFTPEEVANKGLGLEICYGLAPSPFGICFVAMVAEAVCYLGFSHTPEADDCLARLHSEWWCEATFLHSDERVAGLIKRLFEPTGLSEEVRVITAGTVLQKSVWHAITTVGFGQTTSYSELAHRAGNEMAVRAVATCVGQNPISYIVPCHRIVRKNGQTGQYLWGSDRKKRMIEWEMESNSRQLF